MTMAHVMLKAHSFLFYFLAFVFGLFFGLFVAGWVDAGKDQMLAGGAIVLGYGVMGAVGGLVLALFLTNLLSRKAIVWANAVLALAIAGCYAYLHLNYRSRQADKEDRPPPEPKKEMPVTAPANGVGAKVLAVVPAVESVKPKVSRSAVSRVGLGMFTPDFYENPVLYFYGNVNLDKGLSEHAPTDSISFRRLETGGFEIATAPPWLVPDHLKLDYDMLYFKVQTLTHDFLEVTVNTVTHQTAYVDRYAGKIQYWPEFLLNVNSVEFKPEVAGSVHARPFDTSGINSRPYAFLRPVRIKNEWMYVALLGDDFQELERGWIRWRKDGALRITYSLLS